jgi:hypothetical protein
MHGFPRAPSDHLTISTASPVVRADPRFEPAFSGDAIAAQIGDVTGWYANGPSADDYTVAWEIRPGTIVVLTASQPGMTSDDVIELARNTRLTSEDEWRTTYGVEDNPCPKDPNLSSDSPSRRSTNAKRHSSPTDGPPCD